MGPYIDRTREVVRDVYEQLDAAGLADRVSYGLVGYRDSTKAVPALGYVSRIFADLTSSGESFLSGVQNLQAANVSSEGFNEDAYAGIVRAFDEIDWGAQFARYVILITDAGPRLSGDPLAATGLGTTELRAKLHDSGITPWVIHLRTPAGAEEGDHAFAETEYRALANIEGIGSFYHPVEAGSVEDFVDALAAMMAQLTAQVRAASVGFQPVHSAWRSIGEEAQGEHLTSFQQNVARLGYALRIAHLQRSKATEAAPALFNAWMVDRDPADPRDLAVEVRLLLTRDQLSDLHDVLMRILDRAEEGALAPQSFLDELRSLASIVSRDPESVGSVGDGITRASLAELGYMREYMEGLPYRSEVMDLDLSSWQEWSAREQFEFINQLDSKVAYYKALHDNLDLWVSLDGGAVDGDSVYPLLLEALP
jgi:hypothetical protein